MTATAVAVVLALYWLAPWQKPLSFRLPLATPETPGTAPSASGAASLPTPPVEAPAASSAPVADGPKASVTARVEPSPASAPPGPEAPAAVANARTPAAPASSPPTTPPAAAVPVRPLAPSFDVVRVETHGETVIAGRAEPGSDVVLLDGDKVVAQVTVDPTGQFALLPSDLAEGSHYLTLQVQKAGRDPIKSVQGVAVSVAKAGTAKPLVALLSPDQAAKVLSGGLDEPAGTASTASGKPAAPMPVAIQSVEAGQGGKFTAAGIAHPGSQCRVYLNGSYLADVTAGKDGRWSIEVQKGMKAGRYTVRADEIEAGSGRVTHRAEVPFDYPVLMADNEPGAAKQMLMARVEAPKPATPAPAAGAASLAPRAAPPSPAAAVLAPSSMAPPAAPADVATPAGTVSTTQNQAVAAVMPAVAPAPSTAVIPDLQTATVVHGDSLWRISRKMLGRGMQYTEIYASNTNQIRDPDLIYPGQIFVMPSKKSN